MEKSNVFEWGFDVCNRHGEILYTRKYDWEINVRDRCSILNAADKIREREEYVRAIGEDWVKNLINLIEGTAEIRETTDYIVVKASDTDGTLIQQGIVADGNRKSEYRLTKKMQQPVANALVSWCKQRV